MKAVSVRRFCVIARLRLPSVPGQLDTGQPTGQCSQPRLDSHPHRRCSLDLQEINLWCPPALPRQETPQGAVEPRRVGACRDVLAGGAVGPFVPHIVTAAPARSVLFGRERAAVASAVWIR